MVKKLKIASMSEKDGRYMLVDGSTGKIIDDAQGNGFSSEQKARNALLSRERTQNEKLNRKFVNKHFSFVVSWSDIAFDYFVDGEKSDFNVFKDMLVTEVPDFEGDPKSLFEYLKDVDC